MTGALLPAARRALAAAADAYRAHPQAAARCAALTRRLDGPMRLALAGRVKAGKSTLLNALVGDCIAPADVGECTRIVTWYRAAPEPWITMEPRTGPPRSLPVRHDRGALEIDLGGVAADDVERLLVDWPSPDLHGVIVIDTPGVASLSTDVSARATRLLDPAAGVHDGADAVIYLMRHAHSADVEVLETVRGARAPFVASVAVLSRADEIGGGRADALTAAADVAARYRADPTLRGLCLDVVPVAGLLAQTGRTLAPHEAAAVLALGELPPDALDDALSSVDRLLGATPADLSRERLERLLDRFGLFGLRTATRIVTARTSGAAELGAELVRRSGLADLQASLTTRLRDRSHVLVARSVLLGLRRLLAEVPGPGTEVLAAEVDRALRGAHELVEMRALTTLRTVGAALPPEALADGLALLGDAGPAPRARLRLPPDSPDAECRARAGQAVHRWRTWAENPLVDHATAVLCRTVVRTCEGIVDGDGLTSGGARRTS